MKDFYCRMYVNGEYICTFKTYEDYHNYIQRVDLTNELVTFEYSYE